jgi:uncharacterized protein YegL
MDSHTIGNLAGGAGFNYEAAGFENLGASDYTLITIAVDGTGSVRPFAAELKAALKVVRAACNKLPRRKNLLLRVIEFSTLLPGGVREIHGFMPLADIDPKVYDNLTLSGGTPLYDAAYNGIAALVDYGDKLAEREFPCNGIFFLLTDSDDNASLRTPAAIHQVINDDRIGPEKQVESLVSILIGVNAGHYRQKLLALQQDAGFGYYFDAGVTEEELLALAEFIVESVSSQSQSLGTGGPSQNIPATI